MSVHTINLQPIDIRQAGEQEYAALNRFDNIMRVERTPEDPAHSLDEDVAGWQNIPAFVQLCNWIVWSDDGKQIIASGGGGFADLETNRHLMFCNIEVLAEHRRRGLGRALLAQVADAAEELNRRLLVGESYSTVPAGESFAQRIGAKRAMEGSMSQLSLSEMKHDLIEQWMRSAETNAGEFELGFWLGAYPEQDLSAICELMDVMNTAPRGDLDMEDWHQTPERMRENERAQSARGVERWTAYVRHKASGELAGFTSVGWNAHQPQLLEQYGTGVLPKYRNHGLGRWLKAAMLERVLRARPQVQQVRTGNAHSNAPMLKINRELGFKHYFTEYDWQVETEAVRAYLDRTKEKP